MVAIIAANSYYQFKILVIFCGQGSSNSYPFFHSSISSLFRKHDSSFSINLSTWDLSPIIVRSQCLSPKGPEFFANNSFSFVISNSESPLFLSSTMPVLQVPISSKLIPPAAWFHNKFQDWQRPSTELKLIK